LNPCSSCGRVFWRA